MRFVDQTGASSNQIVWVSMRETTAEAWSTPVNLGAPINSPFNDIPGIRVVRPKGSLFSRPIDPVGSTHSTCTQASGRAFTTLTSELAPGASTTTIDGC